MGKKFGNFDDLSLGEIESLVGKLASNLPQYGTWTPQWEVVSGTISTGTSQSGTYIKIGELVICSFSLSLSATQAGSPSGYLRIAGLPFTAYNTEQYPKLGTVFSRYWSGNYPSFVEIVNGNLLDIYKYNPTSDPVRVGSNDINDSGSGFGSSIRGTVVYRTFD